jgi:peroxiredoxin
MDVNQRLPEFQALGLNVVSISVDAVAEITAFAEARSIRYPMLADTEGAINKRLGIRDEQYPTGSYAFGVPRPTLYVVDRAAVVRARYMEPTYKTRPDLDVVIRDARALGL